MKIVNHKTEARRLYEIRKLEREIAKKERELKKLHFDEDWEIEEECSRCAWYSDDPKAKEAGEVCVVGCECPTHDTDVVPYGRRLRPCLGFVKK